MFTPKHYINTISLFLVAFTNSFLILSIDNEFRLMAFIFFLGYIVIFPGLSLQQGIIIIKSRVHLFSILAFIIVVYLAFLFTRYSATGILPALTIISYCYFLFRESDTNMELAIRILMFLTAPAIFLEIVFNGSVIAAVLLLIIIIYLQSRSSSQNPINISFYFFSVLSGAVLVVSSDLIVLYLFFLLFVFRNNFIRLVYFPLISIISFVVVTYIISDGMLPDYLSYYFGTSLLFSLPLWTLMIYLALILYIGWITADLNEVYFTAGIFIAVPVIIILILNIVSSGVDGLRSFNYLKEFQLTIPLFISAIKDVEVDRFAGRIFPVKAA